MTTTKRPPRPARYYAAAWRASSPVCLDECVTVHAFASRLARDAWVAQGRPGHYWSPHVGDAQTRDSREALSPSQAARYLRAILRSVYGGRQAGWRSLRELHLTTATGETDTDDGASS